MIAVSILDNSITYAHTYVIMVLCIPVATHGHLPSFNIQKEIHNLNIHKNSQNLSPIPSTGFTKSATCTKKCWGTGVLYWNSTSVKIYVQRLMRREDNNMSSTY